MYGFPQDHAKALALWKRAAVLGCATAYHNVGFAYYNGRGVEVDKKKANHYWELAAMRGDADSRYNLGLLENKSGNKERALKHYMIAVEFGCNDSLKQIQKLYSKGHVTKDVYTEALLFYQNYLNEVKSSQRDEAAAADQEFKYI